MHARMDDHRLYLETNVRGVDGWCVGINELTWRTPRYYVHTLTVSSVVRTYIGYSRGESTIVYSKDKYTHRSVTPMCVSTRGICTCTTYRLPRLDSLPSSVLPSSTDTHGVQVGVSVVSADLLDSACSTAHRGAWVCARPGFTHSITAPVWVCIQHVCLYKPPADGLNARLHIPLHEFGRSGSFSYAAGHRLRSIRQ